jgi:DNA-binding IclR family transcriptional regulator
MNAANTRSVPSLERSLLILEALAKSANGLTLSQLARQLAVPKSSLHCLLLTFERGGYLHRDEPSGRFRFGLKLYGLANMAFTGLAPRRLAMPFLHALAQKTRLTTHLAILEQSEAVLVEKIEPLGMPRLATWIGKRMDLHCTALGKALISTLPDADFDRLLQGRGLLRHNENTITSVKRLKEHVAQVRRQGYAVDDEEEEIGTRCIGCPVVDTSGMAVAAISIAGTTAQLEPDRLGALASEVKRTADGIAAQLAAQVGADAAPGGA